MRNVGKVILVLAATAALAACGEKQGSEIAKSDQRPCTTEDVTVSGEAKAKPIIIIPTTCQPPKTLLTKDLTAGTGPEVKAGGNVLANYLLVTWSDQQELDSSFARNEPFEVANVGNAQVIVGWNEGLIGIKEGGRRLLIVPPDKGYGDSSQGGMKPNETLVFVIDAVKVT